MQFDFEKYLTYWTLTDMLLEEPKEGEVRHDAISQKSLFCWTKISVRKGNVSLSILLSRDFIRKGLVNYTVINVTKSVANPKLGTEIIPLIGEQALKAIESI